VDGKERERRVWVRIDDIRKGRLTRSESLPNIRREQVRNGREREIDLRGTHQRALERNSRNVLENRSDERIFRRKVRDRQYDVPTNRDNNIDRRSRTRNTRKVLFSIFINLIN